jgi:hypothetical protein
MEMVIMQMVVKLRINWQGKRSSKRKETKKLHAKRDEKHAETM